MADAAVAGAHVLVVEVPGWWLERVAVEQAVAARGWRPAVAPADADVLLVCGAPGAALSEVVDRLWDQLPGPRARVEMSAVEDASTAVEAAADWLRDGRRQDRDARSRAREPSVEAPDAGLGHGDMGGMGHADMGGMGGMDHGDMGMAPGGIPLAGGGEDRDGLEMDVLRVPLGPVLPHWPAGLVVRCSLSGDVVTGAEVEVLAAAGRPSARPAATRSAPDRPRVEAARRCDGVSRLLAVAGSDHAAAEARRARDELLSGAEHGATLCRLDRLHRRVTRSRTLRWMLRGLGPLDGAALAARSLPASAGGDVHDRLVAMLERARSPVGEASVETPSATAVQTVAVLAALPALVTGLDLAAARLVVASLDPDIAAHVHGQIRV